MTSLRAKIREIADKYCSGDFRLYRESLLFERDRVFFLANARGEKTFAAVMKTSISTDLPPEITETHDTNTGAGRVRLYVCPCSNSNAFYLQQRFSHLKPCVNPGLPGFGAGDRLGLATPGHAMALSSPRIFPVFAQQSIREMERTQRTPEDVIASAVWGIVQQGFTGRWGSDADHLKTVDDIEYVCNLPWTLYTLDPSELIVNPETLSIGELKKAYQDLPWAGLQSSPDKLIDSYTETRKTFTDSAGQYSADLSFDEESIVRSAVKYAAGMALCAELVDAIEAAVRHEYELEISFDETAAVTTPLEHFFIASELERLNIPVKSLALRFPGAFEKGVDYKGDIKLFEEAFAIHSAIKDSFGKYRLSIHSGSDKLSAYPVMSKYAGKDLHVKTAGTSYLEALRVVAGHDGELFKELLDFSYSHYEQDRKSYHVSADVNNVPSPEDIDRDDYASLLDDDEYRQIFHVTFGSVLTSGPKQDFRKRICRILSIHEEDFNLTLEKHFKKHLECLNWT